MEVKLVAPIGKTPRVDAELKQKLKSLPENASIEDMVEVLRTYKKEEKPRILLSEHEDLYRLTI